MYLSSVEVSNFRSLKEFKVDLQPGLNVLAGRNNTGKTNLLNAIRHALGPSASRGDAIWWERRRFLQRICKGPDGSNDCGSYSRGLISLLTVRSTGLIWTTGTPDAMA